MSATVLTGDCRETLRGLDAESVHCVVTSPPYWGLRDYGFGGQIGLEPTLEEWVAEMVAVFREVRRVLRPDGVCWLNLGDAYAASAYSEGGHDFVDGGKRRLQELKGTTWSRGGKHGLASKNLLGQPWRVAFALQADGWYLRSDVIWSKPNPMPESVTDRPTKAHEYVFLLTKAARYFYDADAVREDGPTYRGRAGGYRGRDGTNASRFGGKGGFGDSDVTTTGRNLRTVWTIPTQPYPEAHFATFPEALVDRCVRAGCPAGGTVLDPFAGTGTVGVVAHRNGCNSILIEANPEYVTLMRKRLDGVVRQPMLFAGRGGNATNL